MKRTTLTIIAVIVLLNSNAMAVLYEDGLSHNITTTTLSDYIIRDSFLGGITELNILPGGSIRGADVYDNSVINIAGGLVTYSSGTIEVHDSSNAYISDGTVTYAIAKNNSQITISGGTIGRLWTYDNSNVFISGGTINNTIYAEGTSVLTFIGKDFVFGGVEVEYGTFDTLGATSVHAPLSGLTLAGDPISYDLLFYEGTQVVLIPEPMTLSLLALGGLLMRKRK